MKLAAADAFGNALGNSIVNEMQSTATERAESQQKAAQIGRQLSGPAQSGVDFTTGQVPGGAFLDALDESSETNVGGGDTATVANNELMRANTINATTNAPTSVSPLTAADLPNPDLSDVVNAGARFPINIDAEMSNFDVGMGNDRSSSAYLSSTGPRFYLEAPDDPNIRSTAGVANSGNGQVERRSPAATDATRTLLPPGQGALSENGLDFIKSFEGFRSKIYLDPGGNPTIGYGHKLQGGEAALYSNGISELEATSILSVDVSRAENDVRRLVPVSISQNQFDALVSFAFNAGGGALTPRIVPYLAAGDPYNAAVSMGRYTRSGPNYLQNLEMRRASEADLFLSGEY